MAVVYNRSKCCSMPACVDKHGCVFHFTEEGFVTQSLGFWRQRTGHDYKVALGDEGIHRDWWTKKRNDEGNK